MKKILVCLSVILVIFAMPIHAEDVKKPETSYFVKYLVDTNSQIIEFRMYNQEGKKLRLEKRAVITTDGKPSEPLSIMIYRADLMLSWEYNPQIGKLNEKNLTEADIPRIFGQNPYQIAKKVGEEKVLGYECDIFDFDYGNIRNWIIKGTSILLKSISKDGSKTEATEIVFGKQDDDLFN